MISLEEQSLAPLEVREAAVSKLREKGHKATPQRLTILRAMDESSCQSLDQIRRRCPGVSIVTLYRTLSLFGKLGIARRVDFGDGPRYRLAGGSKTHFVCEPCGRVFDLSELVPEVLRGWPGLEGLVAEVDRIEIYGRHIGWCEECS